MSQQSLDRQRSRSRQDGVAAGTAVVGAAVAVVVVAGGGWAIARSGDGSSSSGAGAPETTMTTTHSPTSKPSHQHRNDSWSQACARAAKTASRAGYAVLAPSELPAGWSLRTCRYSAASGWHMEIVAGQGTLSVDQRKGAAAAIVEGLLGTSPRQGKDVHAEGTGTWQSWSGTGGKHALSRSLSSTGVAISGHAGVALLDRLASTLLTYEDAPSGNNGG